MDEYLTRRSGSSTGSPPIDTGDAPDDEAEKSVIIIDLERNEIVSAMSNLDLLIREILSDHLERGDPAIGQDRLVDALVAAGESLQQESAEDIGQLTLTPREAQENVLIVLRLLVLSRLEQQEEK